MLIDNEMTDTIIKIILDHYPTVQGVYLFGSQAAENQWDGSDIDLALLLTHDLAKQEKNIALSPCRFELEKELRKKVDLVNARLVSTVFQKEIISGGRLIHCADRFAVDEFEMLTLSYYQKLNEERREILESFYHTGRAYPV